MEFNHLHVGVRDLPAALSWLAKVWDIEPSFENGSMASLMLHGTTLVLDSAAEDAVAIIGFASNDCDRDYRQAADRGAEILQSAQDRAWGVRSAYLRGPGPITFEIEQELPNIGRRPLEGT